MAENSILNGREILVVEDEVLLRKRMVAYLESNGVEVTAVGNVAEARNCLSELSFDFALVDIHLPDGEGLDLLREQLFSENTGVVIMTAEGGVKRAVEAMRLGALDYLTKPFDYEELPVVLARAQNAGKSARLLMHHKNQEAPKDDGFFFGESLGEVQKQLEKILQADRRLGSGLPPVLIEGATGTGKTTVARWIHHRGPRSDKELVDLNCSTLPDNLVESELFGHERGAFTDAKSARIGLFEAADKGTLFLDEIPSLPLAVQAKVLTAIEDRKIRRVGGNKDIPVDVRLVVATNQDLRELVKKREFREDLYHRLDLLRIKIPPLKDRGFDIVHMANHLLAALCKRYRIKKVKITKEGERQLLDYTWPGNVRELAHELERCIVLGDGADLDFSHLGAATRLPFVPGSTSHPFDPKEWLNPNFTFPEEGFKLEEAINRLIQLALKQSNNNVSRAARLLGVTRDYIRYRLK